MKVKITKKEFLFLLIFLAISITLPLFAAEISWPRSPTGFLFDPDTANIRDLVRYLYDWGIFLGGLVAFFALVIAGVGYLTSFGNPTAMQDARERIWSAILGLIFLLASWLILNTISPQFTTLPELTLDVSQLQALPVIVPPDIAKKPPCDYAEVFSQKNWIGDMVTTSIDEVRGDFYALSVRQWRTLALEELYKEEAIPGQTETKKSGIIADIMAAHPGEWERWTQVPDYKIREALKKIYPDSCKDVKCEPPDGPRKIGEHRWEVADGDCTLQIHTGGWFFGFGCGGRKAEVYATDKDLSRWTDADIKCWKLVSASKHVMPER